MPFDEGSSSKRSVTASANRILGSKFVLAVRAGAKFVSNVMKAVATQRPLNCAKSVVARKSFRNRSPNPTLERTGRKRRSRVGRVKPAQFNRNAIFRLLFCSFRAHQANAQHKRCPARVAPTLHALNINRSASLFLNRKI